jgi:hypothetical protein
MRHRDVLEENRRWQILSNTFEFCPWTIMIFTTKAIWNGNIFLRSSKRTGLNLEYKRSFAGASNSRRYAVFVLPPIEGQGKLTYLMQCPWLYRQHYQFLGAFAKLRGATINSVMSVRLSVRLFVRPLGKARHPLDRFSWNFIFEYFSKICWKKKFHYNRTRITGALHETNLHFWSYLIQLFVELKMFLKKL